MAVAAAAPVASPTFTGAEMKVMKALKKADGKLTYAELAEKLGKTEGTLKQDISKIRSKFSKFKGGKVSIHDEVSKGGMGIPDVIKQGGRGAPRSTSLSLDDALEALSSDDDDSEDEQQAA